MYTERNRIMTAALKFLLAGVLHYDLLSSASVGEAPKTSYKEWLNCDFVNMTNVMGCEAWALEIIGDMAALETQIPIPHDDRRIDNIGLRLRQGIDHILESTNSTLSMQITRVYATAAVVQLQAIQQKPGSTQKTLCNAVEDVIEALRQIPSSTSLRGLPWPICVGGCFAQQAQREFFTSLIRNVPYGGRKFSNFATVLRIMKFAWQNVDKESEYSSVGHVMRAMGLRALLA